MKTWILTGGFTALTAILGLAAEDYTELNHEAESLYEAGSYAKAHARYREVLQAPGLVSNEVRWVEFRLADTRWRSAAASQRPDATELDEARTALEHMVRDTQRDAEKDRVWVEVQESLGDLHWAQRRHRDWHQAWPHYERALDWWAGQSDLDTARRRYLSIVWRCARPPQAEPFYHYGRHGSSLPLPILRNALAIGQSEDDIARAHYLIAITLQRQGGRWEQQARVAADYEAALALGRGTDWYDDALFNYAQWMEQRGRFVALPDGGYRNEPDYVRALGLYRQLLDEFEEGETRYHEQATRQTGQITGVWLGISVANVFLPGSEIEFNLNWRNIARVDLALYPVDLSRDVDLADLPEDARGDWLASIELAGRETILDWAFDTRDKGTHVPGHKASRLDEPLAPGAYVLVARADGKSARDLVLVTDAAVVLKTSSEEALVYVCDARTGAPLADSEVTLWTRWREDSRWWGRKTVATTDPDGLAVFDLPREKPALALFVGTRNGDRQAFSTGNSWWNWRDPDVWKIYAFTDRPAYRPGETAQWKFTARRHNGSVYSTPDEARVEFEITGPRGAKLKSDTAVLNQFGSAWGSLELTPDLPLGPYRITFWKPGRTQQIGGAALFRLEEYKLPEFEVTVTTPEEERTDLPGTAPGRKAYRLGDTVEATVVAAYYFGGPVTDADVEVVVYQKPFHITWPEPREFPWFYRDMDSEQTRRHRSYGRGQVVHRETLKTDASGQATLRFETPANETRDYEYRIEGRVTDASRREIVGRGTVRVTRQHYYVHARADHNLYRPEDRVTVDFQAQDANGNPVAVEGTVKVTRQYWWEVWLKPDGTEVEGEALKELRARHALWPPPPERPDQKGWTLKFRGYEQEALLKRTVNTDTNGILAFSFEPERVGYYHVEWISKDTPPQTTSQLSRWIRAATTVWVSDKVSTDIGYRHGGLQIIADQDTFHVGSEAPVMLVANSPNRHVLFSVEGESLHSYRVVHLSGTVKLLHVAIDEQHVPNTFLGAVMVADGDLHADTRQIVVPPKHNFLSVEITPDRGQYQPRDHGAFTVTTRDHQGAPVSAEVALSLVDESVFSIQNEYATDPRQFFFGTKRPHAVRTQSTLEQKPYITLVEGDGGELRDKRDLDGAGRGETLHRIDSMREEGESRSFGFAGYDAPARPSPRAMPTMAEAVPALATQAGLALAPMALDDADPAVVVRSDFRSTLLWLPDVTTDSEGRASVAVTYPDSVTGWRATARAATAQNQFGSAEASTRTRQPLIVRLQAPRFFVVGDEVILSAVVNNSTDAAMEVEVTLDMQGGLDRLQKEAISPRLLSVPARGEARADWKARVVQPGETTLKVIARASQHADAMEKSYVVFEHGIEKFIAKSGKVRGKDLTVTLDLPTERKPGSTSFAVQVTPSLAVTLLDALPYLADYPYGCTEQTLSRFLPAVITAGTLEDLGLQPEDILGRRFGGINPQHRRAPPPPEKDLTRLNDMTRVGLERLYDFQHSDGGWGWWKTGDSDPWMTAYVVWGLALAREAGTEVRPTVVRRGAEFLDKHLIKMEEQPDLQSWMLHALAVQKAADGESGLSRFQEAAFDNLWEKRDSLNAYTRALFALAAHHLGNSREARLLIENLENGVIRDDRPDQSVLVPASGRTTNAGGMGTAHWGEDGVFRRWSDGGVEATAFALRALLAIDPENALVEPVMNWLVRNRRGAQWSNTRDTAIVVLALSDYLRISGELEAQMDFQVFVNGKSIAAKRIHGTDMFTAPSRFEVDTKLIKDGTNEIRITRNDDGAVYFAVEAKFFTLEEPIPAAGNEIFVKRQYFKLVGRPTLLKGYVYDRIPLGDGERVESGDRVDAVITIEAKNHYEYLVFEDLKPAGFEAVQIRSGQSLRARELKRSALERTSSIVDRQPSLDRTGRSRGVHQELRDRQVALFIDKLPEGIWELQYTLRAEVPGTFHALPVLGHAMYVPEIRCNGDETRVTVTEQD
jgi:uncharacterized protein YfaS (alpha-2-macroglobulin family)